MNRGLRAFLSIWLCFHLFCVFLAPNKETYLGFRVAPLVEPYVNLFEFASSWNFFAPDPGPPPVFLEWEILDREGVAISRGQLPEFPDPYFLRERQNRRIAMTRFLIYQNSRAEKVMLPYLCKRNEGATAVRLWKTGYTIPSITDVAEGKRHIGDDVGKERRFISHSFCAEPA